MSTGREDLTVRSGRVGRPGVIDRPMSRTANVAGAAAAIAHSVERRGQARDYSAATGPTRSQRGTPDLGRLSPHRGDA